MHSHYTFLLINQSINTHFCTTIWHRWIRGAKQYAQYIHSSIKFWQNH